MDRIPPLTAAAVFNTQPGTYEIITLDRVLNRIDELHDWIMTGTDKPAVRASRLQFLMTPINRLATIIKTWEQEHGQADRQSMPAAVAAGAVSPD